MTPSPRSPRLHVVLLAGGSGTRFWPYSRTDRPKQFVALAGPDSLLRQTWQRARRLVSPTRLWVVAPRRLESAVRAELPGLRRDRLLLEPTPRDTAPAIALAALAVRAADPRAVMAVLPTDHAVADAAAFDAAVRAAAAAAADGALVCLGVRPDRPATGFGYLECARAPRGPAAVPVTRFVEKPDAARARRFVRGGRHLWNAGMFVWRPEAFLAEAARVAPDVHDPVERYFGGSSRAWARARKASVDFAVMENARGVAVVALDAGWDDVGSWDAAARLTPAAGAAGPSRVLVGSAGSAVFGGPRLVAVVDVPDVVVVDTPDALLVVARGSAERVRDVVAGLRERGREDLL